MRSKVSSDSWKVHHHSWQSITGHDFSHILKTYFPKIHFDTNIPPSPLFYKWSFSKGFPLGCAMAQVVSHQLHTVEAQVHARVNLVGFVVDRGTETGFSPTSSVSRVSVIPPRLSAHISSWGKNNEPTGGHSSGTWSYLVYVNNNNNEGFPHRNSAFVIFLLMIPTSLFDYADTTRWAIWNIW
jgi:hypothetical protein